MFNVRYNVMNIESLNSFAGVRGGFRGECKDVYFVRALGAGPDYIKEIEDMDRLLTERMRSGQGQYFRLTQLPRLAAIEDSSFYSGAYEEWLLSGRKKCHTRRISAGDVLETVAGEALDSIAQTFRKLVPNTNDTFEKTLVVKILFWLDFIADNLSGSWTEGKSCKLVLSGSLKKQEYLFAYFMTMLGLDVLLLLPEMDAQVPEGLLALSASFVAGPMGAAAINAYDAGRYDRQDTRQNDIPSTAGLSVASNTTQARVVNVRRPERDQRTAQAAASRVIIPQRGSTTAVPPRQSTAPGAPQRDTEMAFEELAMLAASIVMIAVHDNKGEVIGTGSGIMISEDGYILTNNHVASGGRFYSVRIEDDEKIYRTDEVIKYNSVLDLAIIRIDRRLRPLPVYNGRRKLVRGQKVVAIGSPLGLFNSVSDGIISGFRLIDNVDMIQFTAPISHGSSGGAVLNMYGQVIGISTAGFDNGQNINLAVGYEFINTFISGFVN